MIHIDMLEKIDISKKRKRKVFQRRHYVNENFEDKNQFTEHYEELMKDIELEDSYLPNNLNVGDILKSFRNSYIFGIDVNTSVYVRKLLGNFRYLKFITSSVHVDIECNGNVYYDREIIGNSSYFDHILFIDETNQFFIHLVTLINERTYYRIAPFSKKFLKELNELSFKIQLTFGSYSTAISNFEFEVFEYEGNQFNIPISPKLYKFDLSESQLIVPYCNNFKILTNYLNISISMKRHLERRTTLLVAYYLKRLLNRFGVHIWLDGGTILGWYREGDMIKYTLDWDYGLFAEQYPLIRDVLERKFRMFRKNKAKLFINIILGKKNGMFEYRLVSRLNEHYFDLTFFQSNDRFTLKSPYQTDDTIYKEIFHKFPSNLCTAILDGYRFTVPCNPMSYISDKYEETYNWLLPMKKNFVVNNLRMESIIPIDQLREYYQLFNERGDRIN
ncbi:hypothetical protein SNEBB_009882 [Seison nebaliae]|nr:hypothetical protein SNEBB_009882 [Seison nebaliae]